MRSNEIIALAALLTSCVNAQVSGQTSPPKYPSPWLSGKPFEDPSPVPTNGRNWHDAYAKAVEFVSQLTLLEKVNITTGVGWEGEQCVGQVIEYPIQMHEDVVLTHQIGGINSTLGLQITLHARLASRCS